jgi:hypothetical protein
MIRGKTNRFTIQWWMLQALGWLFLQYETNVTIPLTERSSCPVSNNPQGIAFFSEMGEDHDNDSHVRRFVLALGKPVDDFPTNRAFFTVSNIK